MENKKINLIDIALKLDTSVMTVSRALNEQKGVGDELCKKIRLTANDMGYNYKKLRSTDTKRTFVYIVQKHLIDHNSFFHDICSHLKKICIEKNHDFIFYLLDDDYELQGKLPKEITGSSGIIINGEMDKAFIDSIESTGIPYILNYYDFFRTNDSVQTDSYYRASLAAEYLYRKGYRNIGFVGGDNKSDSSRKRYHGFLNVVSQRELVFKDEWLIENYDTELQAYKLHYTLPSPLPEAFICHSDRSAYYFLEKLKNEGIKVPDDVALVCLGNSSLIQKCDPPVTSFCCNVKEYAGECIKLLNERIEGRTKPKHVFLDAEVNERLSVLDKTRKKPLVNWKGHADNK